MTKPHGKRAGDHVAPDGEPRSREDELEELLTRGSRNFRAYRRRAYLAFVGLALTNAFAIWKADENGDQARAQQDQARRDLAAAIATQQRALADAGAEVSERACDADNVLRGRLVLFITDLEPQLEDRARSSFPLRNCALAARPLERERDRRGTP